MVVTPPPSRPSHLPFSPDVIVLLPPPALRGAGERNMVSSRLRGRPTTSGGGDLTSSLFLGRGTPRLGSLPPHLVFCVNSDFSRAVSCDSCERMSNPVFVTSNRRSLVLFE